MKVVSCPKCYCVMFVTRDGEIIWRKLTPCEESALNTIFVSEKLKALVGGYQEFYALCNECKLVQEN
jgi:hypothetical protein